MTCPTCTLLSQGGEPIASVGRRTTKAKDYSGCINKLLYFETQPRPRGVE